MSNCQLTLLVFVFLSLANLLVRAQPYCIKNSYSTNSSTYRANLNTAISTLLTNIDSNGYSNASVGESPNRVNAIILCRGDLLISECRSCAEDAARELLQACPNEKHAIIWKEDQSKCMLRYTNETSLRSFDGAAYWWWNALNATSPQQYNQDLRRLIDDLRDQVAYGGDSLRKVAGGDATCKWT